MNKRLALLARIVPDLHEVHAVMPESRNGGLRLTFPDKRASITFLGNVNVKQPDQCSSVIGGPGIEEFDGIGRLSSLVALFTRVRDCEQRASESSTGSAIWA
jgi:hypothetical protein